LFNGFEQWAEAAVLGAFFVPAAHLAFDDAGVDSVAAGANVLGPHFGQQGLIPLAGRAGTLGESANA
jgi:hypothetical protein